MEEETMGQGLDVAPGSWEWLWQGHRRELSHKEWIVPEPLEQGMRPSIACQSPSLTSPKFVFFLALSIS